MSSLHRGYGDYICSNHGGCRARGVVVSHPLSMREALGSIPSVSRCHYHSNVDRWSPTGSHHVMRWMCMCQALLREVLASSICARPLAGQTPKRKTATEAGKRCFSLPPGSGLPTPPNLTNTPNALFPHVLCTTRKLVMEDNGM